MNTPYAQPTIVVPADECDSYWQPLPSCGYVTVAITPENAPFDTFSAGTQVLPPGRQVREHGHSRNHELVHVCEGRGTVTIDGVTQALETGTTVLFGRLGSHRIDNTGDIDMRLFWVFFPPGLEDWFQAIGRARKPGDAAPEPFVRPENVADIMARMRFIGPRST